MGISWRCIGQVLFKAQVVLHRDARHVLSPSIGILDLDFFNAKPLHYFMNRLPAPAMIACYFTN